MNLKPAFVVLALSLPLAGCGNKGPLILPQSPPAEASPLSPAPPVDATMAPVDGSPIPVEDVPPADDAETPPPPPAGDDGDG